jgi:proteasome accessory factor B
MSRLVNRTSRLRQLEELLLLSPRGLSVSELTEQLQVTRRTIYRDIDFLSAQGVPLWQEKGRFGLDRGSYLATVRLTYQEAMALVLAGLSLARTLDKSNPHVIDALRRLAIILPEFPGGHLRRAANRIATYPHQPEQLRVRDHHRRLGPGSQGEIQLPLAEQRSAATTCNCPLCAGTNGNWHLCDRL